MPLLSVIVPVYNAEQYIEQCVKSIKEQRGIALEVILVDDGSTDRSGILCDLLEEENTCIKAIHIKHGGITKARLAGVCISTGKWITFVDADDWISEDAYKDVLNNNEFDIVITGICRYINEEHCIMQIPYLEEGIYNKEDIQKKILPVMLWTPRLSDWALDPSLCTKIFRREMIIEYLKRASETGSNYGEDSIVIFPMMLQADSVRVSKKIYYYHRQRGAGEIAPYIQDENFISKVNNVYGYLKKQFRESNCWDIMKGQLDCFFINAMEIKKQCYEYPKFKFCVHFPIEKISQKDRVVLYGAGFLGKKYWEQNLLYHFCNIVAWVDTNYMNYQRDDCYIEAPEIIRRISFDFIIIAVDDYYTAKEIILFLNELGVKKEKIVWNSVRVNHRIFEEIEGVH